jgi:hypothetical protein
MTSKLLVSNMPLLQHINLPVSPPDSLGTTVALACQAAVVALLSGSSDRRGSYNGNTIDPLNKNDHRDHPCGGQIVQQDGLESLQDVTFKLSGDTELVAGQSKHMYAGNRDWFSHDTPQEAQVSLDLETVTLIEKGQVCECIIKRSSPTGPYRQEILTTINRFIRQ